MEAAGLMDSFPCLVIRGICDVKKICSAMGPQSARGLAQAEPVGGLERVSVVYDSIKGILFLGTCMRTPSGPRNWYGLA